MYNYRRLLFKLEVDASNLNHPMGVGAVTGGAAAHVNCSLNSFSTLSLLAAHYSCLETRCQSATMMVLVWTTVTGEQHKQQKTLNLFLSGKKEKLQQRKFFSRFFFCFPGKVVVELVKKCRKNTTEEKKRMQTNKEGRSQWDQLPLVAMLGFCCQTNVYFRM